MCESILGLAMPLKLYFSFFVNWTRDFIFYLFTHPCVFSVVPSCFAERFSRVFWVESWLVRLEGDTYPSTLAAGRKHVF